MTTPSSSPARRSFSGGGSSKGRADKLRIGFHVSIEDGLPKAVGRAIERGCTAFQVFCGNPRGWRLQKRADGELARFDAERRAADLAPLFVHACYLINPCAHDRTVRRRSIRRLAAELAISHAMGADGYVLHPGSHKGRPHSWGIDRAEAVIGAAIEQAGAAPMVLLENTAGPHGPGGDFATLGELVARLARRIEGRRRTKRIGIAVDSCHAFGAGYDLREPGEVARLAEDIDRRVGVGRLRLLHVNDSRDAPGSRRDRHAHIGRGTIGRKGLRNLLTHPDLAGLPLILETPWESVAVDRRNLRAVRSLL